MNVGTCGDCGSQFSLDVLLKIWDAGQMCYLNICDDCLDARVDVIIASIKGR